MPNRFYVRQFLNRRGHHGGGYLLASVPDTSALPDDADPPWVEFELADCSRRVALDFPLGTRADRQNSLHKAHLLLREIGAFVEALEAEVELAEQRGPRCRVR